MGRSSGSCSLSLDIMMGLQENGACWDERWNDDDGKWTLEIKESRRCFDHFSLSSLLRDLRDSNNDNDYEPMRFACALPRGCLLPNNFGLVGILWKKGRLMKKLCKFPRCPCATQQRDSLSSTVTGGRLVYMFFRWVKNRYCLHAADVRS